MKDLSLYLLYMGFFHLMRILPKRAGYYLGIGLGELLYLLLSKRKKIALKNMGVAFGHTFNDQEKEALMKKNSHHLGLMLMEFIYLHRLSTSNLGDYISIEGEEHLQGAFQEKRGVIFYGAHLGNWEWMCATISLLGYPLHAVAKVQKNPYLDRIANELRQEKGINTFTKGFSLRQSYQLLKKGEGLVLLSDQYAGRRGQPMDFFGKKTSTFIGAVKLAQKTQSLILPTFFIREGWLKHRLILKEAFSVPKEASKEEQLRILKELISITEDMICEYKEQWLWMHRRFRD